MTSKYPATSSLLAALLLVTLAAPSVRAQTANPATATAADSEDDAIVLSPFVVTAEEDTGSYIARSTLAGTRIRTELKDVGSAITIVTSKFLQDTDSRSNADLLKYTTNTEVSGIGGNFSNAGRGAAAAEPSLLRPNGNTRVRGLTAADNTRNFFLTDIPWDGYNIGRVDIQRGPNSILYGLGSPAGIINSSTNGASFKNSGKVEFRIDSFGSFRASLDLNHVLIDDQLALRIAAVDDDSKYRQKPAYDHDKRIYAAVEFNPAMLKKNGMQTSIRANYEKGDIKANRPRELTPADYLTPWWTQLNKATFDQFRVWTIDNNTRAVMNGAANPTFNPWLGGVGHGNNATAIFASPGATTASGFRNWETGNAYWGIGAADSVAPAQLAEATANNYFGIGSPGAWTSTIEGPGGDFSAPIGINSYTGYASSILAPTPSNPTNQGLPFKSIGAYKDFQISDPSIFDFYNKLIDGPNKWEKQKFETANIALSQTFFDNRVGLEAVYDKQNYRESNVNGVNNAIYVDINATQPGTAPAFGGLNPANPLVGQAYVTNNNFGYQYNSEQEAKRVTAFAELRASDFLSKGRLERILGRHTFTGMYSDEEKDTRALNHVRYAMGADYAFAMRGTRSGDSNIDGSNRSVAIKTYISGDLRGVASPTGLNLSNVTVQQVPQTLTINGVSGVWAFDSHWAKPANPSDPNYVNPAAPFNNTRNGGAAFQNQGNNLQNYYQFHQVAATPVQDFEKGAQGLYTNGLKTWRQVKSKAFVWQGHLFDDMVVPTFGWRKDDFRGAGVNATRNGQNQINPYDPNWMVDHDQDLVSGQSRSWSIVARLPRSLAAKLPWQSNVSVFYNKSDNFQPKPGDVDIYGQALANPQGKTKDYGFLISALDEKINFKVNWYETSVFNDRLQGFEFWRVGNLFGTLLQSAYRVRHKDPSNPWKWDYSNWGANGQATAETAAQLVLTTYNTDATFKNFVDGWGMTANVDTAEGSSNSQPPGINATADTVSKGIEFELQAEPLKGWNLSINASKTNARQTNVGGTLKTWIQFFDPLMAGPMGDLRQWWAGDSNNFRTLWASEIKSQYNLLAALEEGNVPDLRPWRYNLVSDYNFGSSNVFGGRLKGVNVGGAYRWEAGNVIGFPVISGTDATTGQPTLVYDVQNPYKGPSESHLDVWVGYQRKLRKVDWRIQLNVRDVFAEKKLIAIQTQPDGTVAQYRLPALTSWSITNSFSF